MTRETVLLAPQCATYLTFFILMHISLLIEKQKDVLYANERDTDFYFRVYG